MQSVFGLHNLDQFNIFVYATSPSDGSSYRQKIEREAQHFVDISSSSFKEAVEKILADNIHIRKYKPWARLKTDSLQLSISTVTPGSVHEFLTPSV
jgi:hypothetical protein